MKDIAAKTVLITGASSGIGRALASIFAAAGSRLVLVARRSALLEQVKAELESRYAASVTVVVQDLTLPGAGAAIIDRLSAEHLAVDILVNNAGYSVSGPFVATDLRMTTDMLRLSIDTAMALVHGLVPAMAQRGFGRVLTVASLAGLMPAVAGHAAYAATKAFLISFSRSLDLEHRASGVRFTVVCPGIVESEFHERAGTSDLMRRSPRWAVMTSERAARLAFEALRDDRSYGVLGGANRMMAMLVKMLPTQTGVALANSGSR